ncbi:MAG: PrsW family glutamic-type intramembrane protease [Chloroflexota bacterium]
MFNPRLLTPPQQEEEVYPYREVWRSVVIESGIMGVVTILLFVLVNVIHLQIPERFNTIIAAGLACLPILLWLYFSWNQERVVLQPRQRLLAVALISALVANAIGNPLINDFLQVDRWLPLSSAISRIIGYTFTVGIVQEFLKYLVMRYTIWPTQFRIRLDGVAFGAAAGIGYASVLNLHFAFSTFAAPDVAAAHMFANVALHLVTGILVGYGLSELQFGSPSLMLPVFTVAFAALLTGISIPIRAGLVNATLALGSSISRPILGIVFSVAILIVPLLALSFMYSNAERQAQEIVAGRGE